MTSHIIKFNNMDSDYVIYEDCTIINIKTNHIMKHRISKSTGRVYVRLTNNKKRKEYRLSRLMATYFVENPDPKNKVDVHHKDKNVLNNVPSNLQWVTKEEHYLIHKGDKNHPFSSGENHSGAILTNDQVHEICKLIQDNIMSQNDIARKYKVMPHVIHEIRLKHNWNEITKYYDFSKYSYGNNFLKDDKVKEICYLIESNKYTLMEISKKSKVTYSTILDIYHKKRYKRLSDNYDFDRFNKLTRYSKGLKKKINFLINEGKSNNEIKNILKLDNCAKTNTLLCRERKKLNQ